MPRIAWIVLNLIITTYETKGLRQLPIDILPDNRGYGTNKTKGL
jgi:hypothetical protein